MYGARCTDTDTDADGDQTRLCVAHDTSTIRLREQTQTQKPEPPCAPARKTQRPATQTPAQDTPPASPHLRHPRIRYRTDTDRCQAYLSPRTHHQSLRTCATLKSDTEQTQTDVRPTSVPGHTTRVSAPASPSNQIQNRQTDVRPTSVPGHTTSVSAPVPPSNQIQNRHGQTSDLPQSQDTPPASPHLRHPQVRCRTDRTDVRPTSFPGHATSVSAPAPPSSQIQNRHGQTSGLPQSQYPAQDAPAPRASAVRSASATAHPCGTHWQGRSRHPDIIQARTRPTNAQPNADAAAYATPARGAQTSAAAPWHEWGQRWEDGRHLADATDTDVEAYVCAVLAQASELGPGRMPPSPCAPAGRPH
jgi:hypothetical protein